MRIFSYITLMILFSGCNSEYIPDTSGLDFLTAYLVWAFYFIALYILAIPFIWLTQVIFIMIYPPIERLIVAIYSFFKKK